MHLDLSHQNFKITENEKGKYIFDVSRNKYVKLTPEEMVRQSCISYLTASLKYPISRVSTESSTRYNSLIKRTDIIVYDENISPYILVECKSFRINLGNDVIDQVLRYYHSIKPEYICITNGRHSVCASVNRKTGKLTIVEDLPAFSSLF